MGFIIVKRNSLSIRKRIVDPVVVNDFTCICQNIILLHVVIFSLSVLEEHVKVLSEPCHLHHRAKTLTFSNISIYITEDIYLKLIIVVNCQKGNIY